MCSALTPVLHILLQSWATASILTPKNDFHFIKLLAGAIL